MPRIGPPSNRLWLAGGVEVDPNSAALELTITVRESVQPLATGEARALALDLLAACMETEAAAGEKGTEDE